MAKRKCNTQVFPYDDLTYCYGKPVLGGIRPAVYAIPSRDLLSFAKLRTNESGTSQENLAVLMDEYIPKPDAYWRKLDIVPTKGSITWETQGEHPARTFLNKAKFVFPGTCEEATAFARQAIHDFLIFAVQQTDGSWRILGSPEFPADVQVSGGTGEGLGGEVGNNIEITATDLCPAPFYKGHLFLERLDCINCAYEAPYQYCENLAYVREGNKGFLTKREMFEAFTPSEGTVVGIDTDGNNGALMIMAVAPDPTILQLSRTQSFGSNNTFEVLFYGAWNANNNKDMVILGTNDGGSPIKADLIGVTGINDFIFGYFQFPQGTTDLNSVTLDLQSSGIIGFYDFAIYPINHEIPTITQ